LGQDDKTTDTLYTIHNTLYTVQYTLYTSKVRQSISKNLSWYFEKNKHTLSFNIIIHINIIIDKGNEGNVHPSNLESIFYSLLAKFS